MCLPVSLDLTRPHSKSMSGSSGTLALEEEKPSPERQPRRFPPRTTPIKGILVLLKLGP